LKKKNKTKTQHAEIAQKSKKRLFGVYTPRQENLEMGIFLCFVELRFF
jgi:hypothetical protein